MRKNCYRFQNLILGSPFQSTSKLKETKYTKTNVDRYVQMCVCACFACVCVCKLNIDTHVQKYIHFTCRHYTIIHVLILECTSSSFPQWNLPSFKLDPFACRLFRCLTGWFLSGRRNHWSFQADQLRLSWHPPEEIRPYYKGLLTTIIPKSGPTKALFPGRGGIGGYL